MDDDKTKERARIVYEDALKRTPDDHRLHENFAEFLESTGNFKAAISQWKTVCHLIPQHHVAYFQAGDLLAHEGQLDDALNFLHKAVALRPDLGEGWLELARIYAAKSEPKRALDNFEQARRLFPRDYRVPYYTGRMFCKLKRHPEAIEYLREALRLRPDNWQAHYFLGEQLGFDGQNSEAKAELEEVIRLKPDYVLAHFNLGVALYKLGRIQEAREQFNQTLRLDPSYNLASAYLDKLRALEKAGP